MLDIILLLVRFEHEPSKAGLGGRAGLGFLCYAMPSPSVVTGETLVENLLTGWLGRAPSSDPSSNICCGAGANGAGQARHCLDNCTLGHLSSKFGHSVL